MASLLFAGAMLMLASVGESRVCTNLTTPVNLNSRTGVFNITLPKTQIDVAFMTLNTIQQNQNFSQKSLTGYETSSGTYNISATFCRPDASTSNSTNITTRAQNGNQFVQVLAHGSGFDRSYWDLAYESGNNSYVNAALAKGYCTFAYDRLGIGNSSHGDPLNEIQAPLEMAALTQITNQLSQGSIPEVGQAFGKNIIHVGHAQGSEQVMAFAGENPNATSGLVLTGYTLNNTFQGLWRSGAGFQDAAQNQPLRFGNTSMQQLQSMLDFQPFGEEIADRIAPMQLNVADAAPGLNYTPGYVAWGNAGNAEVMFMKPPNFDPNLLNFVESTGKQPMTFGDLLTDVRDEATQNAKNFNGPVLLFVGQNDLPYCGGDCMGGTGKGMGASGPSPMLDMTAAAFGGNGTNVKTYIQPMTGNGINLHMNASMGYDVISEFLHDNKLGGQS